MKLKESVPLPARMWVARARSLRSPADVLGRFRAGALRAYIAWSVRSNKWTRVAVGIGAQIHRGTSLHCNDFRPGKRIVVGPRAFVDQYCFFSAGDLIDVGSDCLIGPGCHLLGAGHAYADPTVAYAAAAVISYGCLVLEPNVWLGAGVTVMGNVRIGFGSVVAAGSLVRESVPPLCMVGGNPARILKLFDWTRRVWERVSADPAELMQALSRHVATVPTLDEFAARFGPSR